MKYDEACRWAATVSSGCNADEHRWMYDTIKRLPFAADSCSVIEIGCWQGSSSVMMAAACQERGYQMICIDTFHLGIIPEQSERCPPPEGMEADWLFKKHNGVMVASGLRKNVIHVVGASLNVGKRMRFNDVGFLWIDSAHHYPQARDEFWAFAPSVMVDGVVAFHDAQEDGVLRCIKDLDDAGDLEGYERLMDIPDPVQHDGPATRGGADCMAPWRTTAYWRVK